MNGFYEVNLIVLSSAQSGASCRQNSGTTQTAQAEERVSVEDFFYIDNSTLLMWHAPMISHF